MGKVGCDIWEKWVGGRKKYLAHAHVYKDVRGHHRRVADRRLPLEDGDEDVVEVLLEPLHTEWKRSKTRMLSTSVRLKKHSRLLETAQDKA